MSSPEPPTLPRWVTPRVLDTSNDRIGHITVNNTVNEKEDPSEALAANRQTLDRLRKWNRWWVRRRESLTSYLLSKIYPRPPPLPSSSELRRLALAFFPPRATGITVEICDIGEGRLERHNTTINKLEPYLKSKPDWVTVRWIHAPVGLGLVHHNIRESFIKAGQEAGSKVAWYEHAGQDLSCEAVSLRDKHYLQDQLDVFNILRDFDSLMDDHDIRSITGAHGSTHSSMQRELQRTAINHDVGTTFWHLTLTDIPWQLGEGTRTSLLDTDLGINPASTVVQDQFLSRHPSYEDAVLVRSLFQCYHRDGFVLTLSPLVGTSFVNQSWLQELRSNPSKGAAHDKKSVIGYLMNRYAVHGTVMWPVQSTTWFVVEMLTKLLTTPTQSYSGLPVPNIQRAYMPFIRDLKNRGNGQLKRNESINLVREYISCMDEISQIHSIARQKLDFLEKLKRDFEDILANPNVADRIARQGDVPRDRSVPVADARTCELAIQSIKNAMGRINVDHEELPGILSDLKSSLHDLFQLRTIEQNELAIIAESNNKAILVFTVVTIVFLPLSFFTSYFGMNIEDTSAILSGQGYFWAVCGSITLVIVTFTLLYGFKDRLYGWLWGNRHSPRGAELYYRPVKH